MITILRIIAAVVFNLFYKVEYKGVSNVPSKGGAILCANHPGTLDMFFIGYKLKRIVHYMAKEELFRNKLLAYILRKLGAFPVKRGKADVESMKTAINLIKEGHIVGILPEGTRTGPNNKKHVKAKPGVALLAYKVRAPIIPVAVSGNYRLFSNVKVVYGEPFYLEFEENKKYTMDEFRQMSQKIMDKIYSLLEDK